jgi:hypothetical protein
MARNILYLAMGAVLLAGCISVHETKRVVDDQDTSGCPQGYVKAPAQVLRHVVLLKFKETTSAADIRRAVNAFCSLPSKIEVIYDFEWGTDVSVENLQKGFTHCFVVTFLSEADRSKYLADPAHKELGDLLKPSVDEIMVIDYWTK